MQKIYVLNLINDFRSVQLFYDDKSNYQGIPGYRYKTGRNFLNEIGSQYKTECYCINRIYEGIVKPDGCLYEGAMDLTTCLGKLLEDGMFSEFDQQWDKKINY